MYKATSVPRRRLSGAARLLVPTLLLVLTLLALTMLTGCGSDPKSDGTQAQSAAAAQTAAAPETTLPPETAAPVQQTEAPSEPETEPAPEPLPAGWTPSLNRTDISFFGAGESFVLTVPGAAGHYEILWSAEDEQIAAVDQTGRVTAVGPGSARIYAELAGTKLTCWIRCKFDAPPAEDEPALDKTDISFFGVGESYRLRVSNVPEGAEILWSSEDYGVASVDGNGRVRAVGPGTIRVRARVGDVVLSCWVRCHFTAPDVPRCSVADGSWLVALHRSSVTAADGESGVSVAQAELLGLVRVEKDVLEALEPYDKLDLSDFGLGAFRVSSVEFNTEKDQCAVTSGETVLRFSGDGSGLWTLLDENGLAKYYTVGTGRFVFTDDSRVSEQPDGGTPIRRADVMDLFDKHPGFEETLSPVELTVSDGLVTNAVWHYAP